ncbi:hypothetical protein ACFL6S_26740 [Candidatus Poribacteria bacterium]
MQIALYIFTGWVRIPTGKAKVEMSRLYVSGEIIRKRQTHCTETEYTGQCLWDW